MTKSTEFRELREELGRLRAAHCEAVERAGKRGSSDGLRALETFLVDNAPAPLHLTACGDFQLMARQHWLDLHGYPEFAVESPHAEALLSTMAAGAGIRECALPPSCCVFRLDTDTKAPGSSRDGVLEAMVRGRIVAPDERTVFVLGAYMNWAGRAMAFNASEWGLGSESLQERVICSPVERNLPEADVRPHRVFDRFGTYEGWAEPGFERTFYGLNVRDWLFTGESKGSEERQRVRVEPPPIGEEYFEWIALLTALTNARERFCIAELGAGWGRWVASAAVLCRQLNLDCRLVAIEAEPSHFEWLQMVLRDNGIDSDVHALRYGAVAAEEGELLLAGPDTPLTMYGNRTIRAEELPEWQSLDGYVFRKVPATTIAELLKDEMLVDLMDIDVQGVEYEILAPSFDELDAKVRIVHIGTHSRAVEDQLCAAFRARGWLNAFVFSCKSHAHTMFGEVDFGDGVQTWVNPRWPELLPALLDQRAPFSS